MSEEQTTQEIIDNEIKSEEQRPREKNPRDEARDAIANMAREREKDKLTPFVTEEEPEPPKEPEPTPEPEPAPEPPPEPVAEPEAQEVVRLKVNGKVIEMTAEEFKERTDSEQKRLASEQIFEKSKAYKEQLVDKLHKQQESTPARQQLTDTDLQGYIERINYGSKEEAALAFKEAVQNMLPDTQSLIAQARTELQAENQRAEYGRKVNEEFTQKYPDVAKDPELYQLVYFKTQNAIQAGDERPLHEIVAEKGAEVDKWLKGNAFAKRTELKKTIDVPKPASQRMEGPKPQKPLTNAQVIADMANQRLKMRGLS